MKAIIYSLFAAVLLATVSVGASAQTVVQGVALDSNSGDNAHATFHVELTVASDLKSFVVNSIAGNSNGSGADPTATINTIAFTATGGGGITLPAVSGWTVAGNQYTSGSLANYGGLFNGGNPVTVTTANPFSRIHISLTDDNTGLTYQVTFPSSGNFSVVPESTSVALLLAGLLPFGLLLIKRKDKAEASHPTGSAGPAIS